MARLLETIVILKGNRTPHRQLLYVPLHDCFGRHDAEVCLQSDKGFGWADRWRTGGGMSATLGGLDKNLSD